MYTHRHLIDCARLFGTSGRKIPGGFFQVELAAVSTSSADPHKFLDKYGAAALEAEVVAGVEAQPNEIQRMTEQHLESKLLLG